jgi:two-component system, cell cycle response regulator DivK
MLAPTDYEITEAENGEEALTAIAKQRPDLILMDIQLPIMGGYEATRRIKADASLRSIPIIAVASYALSGEGQKARVAGCDDTEALQPRACGRHIRNEAESEESKQDKAENRTPRVPRSSKKLLSGNQIHPSRLLPWMGSKRILVVEDQPDNRQIIRDLLAPTDYEITEAENGEQALAAIAKQPPDLILMDIQLPIMDGYTATRQIKADPALRSIPIIAVTSYALSDEGAGDRL